ncbi:hypothetical protein ACLOJK_018898 [Asimina triloba]
MVLDSYFGFSLMMAARSLVPLVAAGPLLDLDLELVRDGVGMGSAQICCPSTADYHGSDGFLTAAVAADGCRPDGGAAMP